MEENQKEAIQSCSHQAESTLSKTIKAKKDQNLVSISFSTMREREKDKRQSLQKDTGQQN